MYQYTRHGWISKCYTEKKKPDTRIHSKFYEILEWAKLTCSDRGERSNCIGPGLCGDEVLTEKLHKEIPGLMDMFYIMTEVIVQVSVVLIKLSLKRTAFYYTHTHTHYSSIKFILKKEKEWVQSRDQSWYYDSFFIWSETLASKQKIYPGILYMQSGKTQSGKRLSNETFKAAEIWKWWESNE